VYDPDAHSVMQPTENTLFYGLLGFCPGLPEQAGTSKVKLGM